MSGHSKWANIKNRKGAQDKKRSETFTKTAKNILTAIRMGGGNTNVESNSHLKVAIEKARESNMPKDNIERLLTNFEERKVNLADYVFEGYGPFGVPVVVEVQSDNKNRILSEIKFIFKDHEGNLGESGSVMFQFEKIGEIELKELPEEKEMELIDGGAEEFEEKTVLVKPETFSGLLEVVKKMGLEVERAEIVLRATNPVVLTEEQQLNKIMDLIETLEDNEEVTKVSAGFDYVEKI